MWCSWCRSVPMGVHDTLKAKSQSPSAEASIVQILGPRRPDAGKEVAPKKKSLVGMSVYFLLSSSPRLTCSSPRHHRTNGALDKYQGREGL